MRLTLESGTDVVVVNGVPGRIWSGVSDSGVRVKALITLIQVERGQGDLAEFETNLTEIRQTAGAGFKVTRKACQHGLGGNLCEECFPFG